MHILIAERDADLAQGLAQTLRANGYAVDVVLSLDAADTALTTQNFDLLIIDLLLPAPGVAVSGLGGLDALRRARTRGSSMPVLMLSSHDSIETRVRCLDLGADDYMAKPYALEELLARLRALTRRAAGSCENLLRHGPLTLDIAGHVAALHGAPLDLSARELGLLEVFMQRPGRLVSKAQLVDHLCEWGEEVSNNAIEVYVHRLRKKLEVGDIRITTVRGLGYCLQRLHHAQPSASTASVSAPEHAPLHSAQPAEAIHP